MKYPFIIIEKAQIEYEEAFIWYLGRSLDAAYNFKKEYDATIELICNDPDRWKNEYREYFRLKIKKYPYDIVYSIDRVKVVVVIKSIFHHRRNTKMKYKA